MTSQKPTEEENKKARERISKIALKNLKAENLMNLASAFLVQKSGAYGKAGESAVDDFKYIPSIGAGINSYDIKSGEEYDLFKRELLNSRQEGRMFSENISMHKIGQDCMNIMQESLDKIKISDLYSELMGGSKKVKENLKDLYVGDLKPQIPQEFDKLPENEREAIIQQQKVYETIIGTYQAYLTDKAVSESLDEKRKSNLKSLEKILVGDR